MEKHLFLGDEAIAQAAIDAGLSGVYAYPGTPSTEITEYIQNSAVAKERNIHSRWSANEKTAMEAALGMSYAGKRSLCCMKHAVHIFCRSNGNMQIEIPQRCLFPAFRDCHFAMFRMRVCDSRFIKRTSTVSQLNSITFRKPKHTDAMP